jgi:hypothetical protein
MIQCDVKRRDPEGSKREKNQSPQILGKPTQVEYLVKIFPTTQMTPQMEIK